MKRQTTTITKNDIRSRHIQAEALHNKRHFKKVIAIYSSILSNVDDAAAYANRGLAWWELKRYKYALADYLKALAINPQDAIAHRSAGELFMKTGKYDKAVLHLKKAINLDPNSSHLLCLLGIAYYNNKDWLKAYRALKGAAKLDATNEIALLGIKKIENHFDLS